MGGRDLNILVIDDTPDRAAILEQGLVEAGYTRVMTIRSMTNLTERVQALAPDVVIIDLANPDRDTLESMFQVTRAIRRPIAMFVGQSDSARPPPPPSRPACPPMWWMAHGKSVYSL